MKSKLAITLLFAALASTAPGALTVGTYINIDYGNRSGTPGVGVSYAGAVNTGQWNAATNGTSASSTTRVDSTGGAATFGTFVGGQTSGAAGNWQQASPTDVVGQDYVYLNNNIAGDVTLNGNTVGSYLRFTIYTPIAETNGIALGQSWNITFTGGGDVVGQGMNLDVNDGGTIIQATIPGPTAVGASWSGYVDGQTYTTLNGINPTLSADLNNYEIEFWMWTPAGSTGEAANSAISGIEMQLVAIPEPSAISLLGLGALGLAVRRRR